MFSRNVWRTATRMTGSKMLRGYASDAGKLRIGYVPEHFATPLAFAQKHFGLSAELVPQPDGTGVLTRRLKAPKGTTTTAASAADDLHSPIDLAFGLTEGFIADLGRSRAAGTFPGYTLVGTYVQSPLRWAISTGAGRDDVKDVEGLEGTKVGVSRVGSGSYVMSFVLAEEKGWTGSPFEVVELGKFAQLREGVKSGEADWFMWDHTTTKKYWEEGELKRIGELYTPWPSWCIAARSEVGQEVLEDVMGKVNQGVEYYHDNEAEAIEYITGNMHYSEADVREWMKTVKFSEDCVGVDPAVVDRTADTLRRVGVLGEGSGGSDWMVGVLRGA